MRTSCNGCRVLRKGCSDSCTLRPCLQWIKSSESQENATVFLAKFYGRSGLLNRINSVPEDLRPTVFRSLLYEACGRMVNPILGSVGLLWSGKWQICQSAVDSILRGSYHSRPRNIYRALSTRRPLRGNRLHNVNSNARCKRSDSIRHATLSERIEHLGLSNQRLPRSYNIPKKSQPAQITQLSGSCTQISKDSGAESEGIDGLTNRTLQIVRNENGCGNDVDAHDQNGDAHDLMEIQAETQNDSREARLFEKNSCRRLEIKQEITDDKSVELELRLGSLDCYSRNPTFSQPAVCNSYGPWNNSCMDSSLSSHL